MEAERRARPRVGRAVTGRNAVAGDTARNRGRAERNRAEPPGRAVCINQAAGVSGVSEYRPMTPRAVLFTIARTADFVCVDSAAVRFNLRRGKEFAAFRPTLRIVVG